MLGDDDRNDRGAVEHVNEEPDLDGEYDEHDDDDDDDEEEEEDDDEDADENEDVIIVGVALEVEAVGVVVVVVVVVVIDVVNVMVEVVILFAKNLDNADNDADHPLRLICRFGVFSKSLLFLDCGSSTFAKLRARSS